jgi:phenylpropionate dioxygenase-like ring-hydroxylating dioxygenase large terminal subunit
MRTLDETLVAPQARGHRSVVRLLRDWYVACQSDDLDRGSFPRKPLAVTVVGVPLVLFRDERGKAAALLDRCAHRNVPLSLGRVTSPGALECGYHGWRFDSGGSCIGIPGLCRPLEVVRRVTTYAVREQDGFVWVCPTADWVPPKEPPRVPFQDDERYAHVKREVDVEGTLHATVENALDVPHTAYLHRGLFRGGKTNRIVAVVRRYRDRVETEYLGEPKPPGLVAKILAPHGAGVVQHWDRFFLPSIAQVEYRLGDDTHFMVTSYCTPVSDFHTRMFAVASFRTPLPRSVVRAALEPVAMRIFRQDAAILRRQTETIRRFGGEQFTSTEIDVMGPAIWRVLRDAERLEQTDSAEGGNAGAEPARAQDSPPGYPVVHQVELEV